MNNFFKILLICFTFVFGATAAQSAVLSAKDIEKEVVRQVTNDLQKFSVEDVEVSVIAVPLDNLTIPNGELKITVDEITTRTITSRTFVRTSIYVDDQYIKSFGIPINIKAYKNVLVANDVIERGSTVNYSMVKVKKIDITNQVAVPVTEKDIVKGITALKPFRPDEIINRNFVKAKPDVAKNAVVNVVFETGTAVSVTVEAIALADGNIGDVINVHNKQYQKVYTGKIIDENRILVKI